MPVAFRCELSAATPDGAAAACAAISPILGGSWCCYWDGGDSEAEQRLLLRWLLPVVEDASNRLGLRGRQRRLLLPQPDRFVVDNRFLLRSFFEVPEKARAGS